MKKLPGDIVAQDLGTPISNNSNSTQSPGGANNPPPSSNGDMKSNVSSFIPSDVNSTLSQIQNPTTFGEQLTNNAKQQVIGVVLGVIGKLKAEIEKTIGAKIKLEVDHVNTLLDITSKGIPTNTYDEFGTQIQLPPIYSPEEVKINIERENASYELAKIVINKNLKGLEDRLRNLILDPYKDIKKEILKFKTQVEGKKKFKDGLKALAKSQKTQQLVLNIAKTLIVTVSSLLTQQLIEVIADSASLQELVDKTNGIIDAATTIDQINQARIARNGCISKINQQEKRIQATIKVLNTLNIILTVFNVLARILDLVPVASPFGILSKPITILYTKAKNILDGISAALCVIIPILQGAIFILEDLKRQLRDLNKALEEKTLELLNDSDLFDYLSQIKNSSNDPTSDINRKLGESDADYADRLRNSSSLLALLVQQNPNADAVNLQNLLNNSNLNTLSGLVNQITPATANNLGTYKGFTFFTREENDPKFNVRGNKRHYVVAVDTKNIERIKSDYSFTLNPQQLVNQLKLVIDQQNLQG
jgi:hypothetical protein